MPYFCSCGADEYICQKCASILCSRDYPPTWDKITETRMGNVCPACMADAMEKLIEPCEICGSKDGVEPDRLHYEEECFK